MFTQESTLRNQVFGELNKFCRIDYYTSSSAYDYIRVKLPIMPLSKNKTITLDEMSHFGKIYDLFKGFHLCDFLIDNILDKDDSVDLVCHFTASELMYPNVVSDYVKSHISFITEYNFSKRNRYILNLYMPCLQMGQN